MKIAIIGAGIAGAAAAFEIARQGRRATVFHDVTGASGLYSGALDFEPWDGVERERALESELSEFSKQLGVWELGPKAAYLATPEGNVRPARGRDRAILNLERCAGKRVAVVDLERDDWDAPLLAKSFASSRWAQRTDTRFFAVPVAGLKKGFERRISGYDFAALHDAPERALALQKAMLESRASAEAWLFGPWLGVQRPLADELSAVLGVPVGETTSVPGGVAGARFELGCERLLARLADVARGRLLGLEPIDSGCRLHVRDHAPLEFSAVVLATGGVAAGGIALQRSFERRGGTGFRLSFAAPITLQLDAEVSEGVSSLAGIDFAERGLDMLLEVGIATRADGSLPSQSGIFAAGDAMAGRPRTALVAADSGLRAARAALEFIRRLS